VAFEIETIVRTRREVLLPFVPGDGGEGVNG
jgi:hypothetical protein